METSRLISAFPAEATAGLARALIEQEYRRSPTLDELAGTARCSTFHFHRRFRKVDGATPKQLILQLKVVEVQRLALTGVSFKDASTAVGFANQSHMSMTFKRVLGTTPVRWLRQALSRPTHHRKHSEHY